MGHGSVVVSVPATSANLGPGFDAVGLALSMRDQMEIVVSDDSDIVIDIDGRGADTLPRNESHLVVRAMSRGFEYAGAERPGFTLGCRNVIPHGRGLGSSAAAIVGGLMLARGLVEDGENVLTDDVVLQLATDMEGHSDNVAAAIFGGYTMSWSDDGVARAISCKTDSTITPILLVPDNEVPTRKAREVLTASVSLADASFNIARSALLTHALTRDPELLFAATADRVHQLQRHDIYPESFALMQQLRDAGNAAMISGAGPSVLVLATAGAPVRVSAPDGWTVYELTVDREGASIRPSLI